MQHASLVPRPIQEKALVSTVLPLCNYIVYNLHNVSLYV